ncbi:MAG: helix-turn-helix domain-containing protein [Acidimicrobiales bacterium]
MSLSFDIGNTDESVVVTPLLLTVEQAAIMLGLGRTTTYELVMRGQLQSVKVGRRRLVLRDGIQRYVDELVQAQSEASC